MPETVRPSFPNCPHFVVIIPLHGTLLLLLGLGSLANMAFIFVIKKNGFKKTMAVIGAAERAAKAEGADKEGDLYLHTLKSPQFFGIVFAFRDEVSKSPDSKYLILNLTLFEETSIIPEVVPNEQVFADVTECADWLKSNAGKDLTSGLKDQSPSQNAPSAGT